MSGIWFRHAANFGEHPKTLRLRRLAGSKADSAECGWWRILEAAKRYGSWTFDDEEHLRHAAGRYAALIPLYRQAGFLDGLTVHNGEEYQAPMTGAERVARHRASNADHVTHDVTGVTPRVEKSREEQREQSRYPDGNTDSQDRYYALTGYRPWGIWSGEKLLAAERDYGRAETIAALEAEWTADPDRKTILDRLLARLARDADAIRQARKTKPRPIRPDPEVAYVESQRLQAELLAGITTVKDVP
jgi:hypothetical protein